MARRTVMFTLLFALFSHAGLAARRHSVSPAVGRCLYGPLVEQAYVSTLAVDATDVYYLDDFDYTLYRVSKDGGLPVPLASLADLDSFVTDMVLDDTTLYIGAIPFVDSGVIPPGAIYTVPKSGGEVRTLVPNVDYPIHLRVDGTHVYWAVFGTFNATSEVLEANGKIERARKDGSERQALAQNLSAPYDLLLSGENVFFTETGLAEDADRFGIRRVPKNGGTIVHIQDTHLATDLAQTDTDIVFYGGTADFVTIGLFRVPKSGGAVQLLVDNEDISGGPRIFDNQVYFAVGFASLERVPVSGGTPQTIAATDLWEPLEFEVDACGVYFGHNEGRLWKVPR